MIIEVPLIALTGGSGLTYYEAVALRGVTDMGMQYLFKKEIDYKQTAINAFGMGIGNYHNNYWGSYVLPNLYSNAIDLNIDIYVK